MSIFAYITLLLSVLICNHNAQPLESYYDYNLQHSLGINYRFNSPKFQQYNVVLEKYLFVDEFC